MVFFARGHIVMHMFTEISDKETTLHAHAISERERNAAMPGEGWGGTSAVQLAAFMNTWLAGMWLSLENKSSLIQCKSGS